MTEALSATVPFVFKRLNFHRIEANYHPKNEKSAAILNKLGFVKEGQAQKYRKRFPAGVVTNTQESG
jgi:[ribosomal protein S5]-alanine N-acetyltransferase